LPEGRTKEVFGVLWKFFHNSSKTKVFPEMPFTEEEVEFLLTSLFLQKIKMFVQHDESEVQDEV
jgi:hypothetical protein